MTWPDGYYPRNCELAADLAPTRTLQEIPSWPLEAAADGSFEGSAALNRCQLPAKWFVTKTARSRVNLRSVWHCGLGPKTSNLEVWGRLKDAMVWFQIGPLGLVINGSSEAPQPVSNQFELMRPPRALFRFPSVQSEVRPKGASVCLQRHGPRDVQPVSMIWDDDL